MQLWWIISIASSIYISSKLGNGQACSGGLLICSKQLFKKFFQITSMFWLGPAFCLVWSGCKPFAKIIRWQDSNFKLVVKNNDWQWSYTLIFTVFSVYIWILSLSGNLKFGQPTPRPDQIIIMLGLIWARVIDTG